MDSIRTRLNIKSKIVLPLTIVVVICLTYLLRNDIRCIYWEYFKDTHCVYVSSTSKIKFLSDSLFISADYYKPKRSNSYSIILLHGSSAEGRKSPLIKTLGTKFSELGYHVLAIDHRGYGDSDKPAFLSAENFNFSKDVTEAINYLIDVLKADTAKIFVVGHSFGAGVALACMTSDSRVNKIVLFGPPRRLEERFFNHGAKDKEYFLERWQKDMNLPYKLEFNTWKEVYHKLDIQSHLSELKKEGHVPLFLIDGEKESLEDRNFMKKIYLQVSPPTKYWTVPSSDHYLNINMQDDKLVYIGAGVEMFVNKVNNWLVN